jgi:hypothetical protein
MNDYYLLKKVFDPYSNTQIRKYTESSNSQKLLQQNQMLMLLLMNKLGSPNWRLE